ncbi:hypothetical protein [Longimicrobium sp.]|uniref:hypothetical protein n=1 Tax=Longimicrobium sp. TaxID=2029185 RepID=UPI002E31A3FC|nr:hypothetical protein [Longimicrobium sp.]HEX6038081.1 hypothetical protein [Longimicrobium sp.]
MPRYRVTLADNLSTRTPSAFDAEFSFRHKATQRWRLNSVDPDRAVAVVTVDSDEPMDAPDTLSRFLIAHYPTAPTDERHQIMSVQPA